MNSQGHCKISEKQTTNICSPKKEETTKHLYSQKSGHYKTFVVLKKRTLQNICSPNKRTLQTICSLKKADPTNHL